MAAALAEKEKKTSIPGAEDAPPLFHWTVEAYHRAADAGAFGYDARVELVNGRVINKMGQGPLHFSLAAYLAKRFGVVLPSELTTRQEGPLPLSFDGEPVPDVCVVRGHDRDFFQRHPTPEEVVLLVEVAVSTEAYDLGEKSLLYSYAGIADYWVVLPARGQVIVHRSPTATGYASAQTLTAEATLSPLAAEAVTLSVRDLLGLPPESEE